MRNDDHDLDFMTFSEIKEEFPKASANWNWTAKMFYYLSQAGLLKRRYNYTIKSHEYSKKSLVDVLKMVNNNLNNMKIDL
ncbi:MAG: hypothetical protein RJQ00_06000 [Vicingaceae bacterium]